MDARDTTTNNADLWSHYLREQWAAFLDPFGLARTPVGDATARTFADVAAANIASVLTALLAPPVARMYETNAAEVTRSVRDQQIAAQEHIEIPEPYMARPPRPAFAGPPPPVERVAPATPVQESVIAY